MARGSTASARRAAQDPRAEHRTAPAASTSRCSRWWGSCLAASFQRGDLAAAAGLGHGSGRIRGHRGGRCARAAVPDRNPAARGSARHRAGGSGVARPGCPERSILRRRPRRALIVALQLAAAVALGLPLFAVARAFLPLAPALALFAAALLFLGVRLWRSLRICKAMCAQAPRSSPLRTRTRAASQPPIRPIPTSKSGGAAGSRIADALHACRGQPGRGPYAGEPQPARRDGRTVLAIAREAKECWCPRATSNSGCTTCSRWQAPRRPWRRPRAALGQRPAGPASS